MTENSLFRRKPSRPYGQPTTPFNPLTGDYLGFAERGAIKTFFVLLEGHDVLLCRDRDEKWYLVAKPAELRKTTFHEQTINEVTYTSTDMAERLATNGVDDDETHLITSSYAVGERITAFKHHEKDRPLCRIVADEYEGAETGNHALWWEDMNTAGRAWAVEPEEA